MFRPSYYNNFLLATRNINFQTSSTSIYINWFVYNYFWLLKYAKLETGNFTSDVYINKHNVGGLTNGGEYKTFSSVTEGVFEMVRNLKVNYINKGLTTPSEINPKYCPTDSNWASKVTQIMESL